MSNIRPTRVAIDKRNKSFVDRYKKMYGCSNCGYKENSYALDMDHLDPSTKRKGKGVSQMANQGYSIETIKKEMRKCRILCANCHRIHTHTKN